MTQAFGRRALLARAGLILGPYEIMGRLQAEGDPPPRPGRPVHGMDPGREQQALVMAARDTRSHPV